MELHQQNREDRGYIIDHHMSNDIAYTEALDERRILVCIIFTTDFTILTYYLITANLNIAY